mgnify:CR=1 FL=1
MPSINFQGVYPILATPFRDDEIALGRMLYYDKRLSKNHDVSCNSCHNVMEAGEDLAVGEEYVEVIPLSTFGRRLVVSAKQNLNQRIKEIEHETDVITHDCVTAIHETFITPIERDDIHRLMSRMDDVMDLLDAAERVLPVLTPETLVDATPLMERPR